MTDTSEPLDTLWTAFLAAQKALPKLEKSAENPHYKSKFITLDTIMAKVLPVLNENGLVWTAKPGYDGDESILDYKLVHAATGQAEEGRMRLLSAKDDPQGQGAAITYARRYSITSVLGISADEDDDGNKAADSKRASQARQAEARRMSATLSPEQQTRMVERIKAVGLDLTDVLEAVGVEALSQITVGQAKRVGEIADAAEKEAEAP